MYCRDRPAPYSNEQKSKSHRAVVTSLDVSMLRTHRLALAYPNHTYKHFSALPAQHVTPNTHVRVRPPALTHTQRVHYIQGTQVGIQRTKQKRSRTMQARLTLIW